MLVVDADLRHVHFFQPRHLFRRRQHFGGTADDLQALLIGTYAVENDMAVIVELLFDRDGDGDGVADGDRSGKVQRLVDEDRSRPRELCAEHGRDQGTAPHAVGDHLAEHAALREFRIDDRGIDVAGEYSKQLDILRHQRAFEARRVSDVDLVVKLVDEETGLAGVVHDSVPVVRTGAVWHAGRGWQSWGAFRFRDPDAGRAGDQ